MIIAMFALTVFLIGGVLGLRFKVLVLVAPIIVGIAAIFIIGLSFGSDAGFILFVIFLGITALQMGYVAGAVIGCFAVKPRAEKELSSNIVVMTPRLYRRSQG